MAVPILPIIKAVGPYVTQIATVAIPAFTSKPAAAKSDPVVATQIEELQHAATQNGQSIQALAEQLQQVILGAEETVKDAKKQANIYKTLLFTSLAFSFIALAVSSYSALY